AVRPLREHLRIALVLHAEPAYGDAVDLLDAGRKLVAPRHVVGRARRQDLDRRVRGEVLGDVAGVEFRAAVDLAAVPLDDDREFHPSWGSRSGGGSVGCESAPLIVSR